MLLAVPTPEGSAPAAEGNTPLGGTALGHRSSREPDAQPIDLCLRLFNAAHVINGGGAAARQEVSVLAAVLPRAKFALTGDVVDAVAEVIDATTGYLPSAPVGGVRHALRVVHELLLSDAVLEHLLVSGTAVNLIAALVGLIPSFTGFAVADAITIIAHVAGAKPVKDAVPAMVVAESGFLDLIASLSSRCADAELARALCTAMYALAATSRHLRAQLIEAGALECATAIAMRYASPVAISSSTSFAVHAACLALGYLTREPAGKLRAGPAGLVALVASLLRSQDTLLLIKASGIAWNLASVPENQAPLRELDVISLLSSLLVSPSLAVRENAAGAIWNLAVDPDNRPLLREAGALAPLTVLLVAARGIAGKELIPQSPALLENATGALWNAAAVSPNREALSAISSVSALVRLVRAGPDAPLLCWLRRDADPPRLRDAGRVTLTGEAATYWGPVPVTASANAAGALRNLAACPDSRSTFLQAGAIPALIDTILHPRPIPAISSKAVGALWLLAADPACRLQMLTHRSGAFLSALADIVAAFEDAPSLAEKAAATLCLLADEDAALAVLFERSALEPFVSVCMQAAQLPATAGSLLGHCVALLWAAARLEGHTDELISTGAFEAVLAAVNPEIVQSSIVKTGVEVKAPPAFSLSVLVAATGSLASMALRGSRFGLETDLALIAADAALAWLSRATEIALAIKMAVVRVAAKAPSRADSAPAGALKALGPSALAVLSAAENCLASLQGLVVKGPDSLTAHLLDAGFAEVAAGLLNCSCSIALPTSGALPRSVATLLSECLGAIAAIAQYPSFRAPLQACIPPMVSLLRSVPAAREAAAAALAPLARNAANHTLIATLSLAPRVAKPRDAAPQPATTLE
jgi:hypothetical protein